MIVVHVEIVALEWMPIHASIDRVVVDVLAIVILIKVDDHLEGSDVGRLKNNVFAICADPDTAHIRCIAIACVRNFAMEEELERGL